MGSRGTPAVGPGRELSQVLGARAHQGAGCVGIYFGEHDYFGKAEWVHDPEAELSEDSSLPEWLEESWLLTVERSPLYKELTNIPLMVRGPDPGRTGRRARTLRPRLRPARKGEHVCHEQRRHAARRAGPLLPRRRPHARIVPGPPLRGDRAVEGGQRERLIDRAARSRLHLAHLVAPPASD